MQLTTAYFWLIGILGTTPGMLVGGHTKGFVSFNGKDYPGCGQTKTSPCQSLRYSISTSTSISSIYLEGEHVYEICGSMKINQPELILKNTAITSYNGLAIVSCEGDNRDHLKDDFRDNINMWNVSITNTKLRVQNAHISFSNSIFYNVSLYSGRNCKYLNLKINNISSDNGHGSCKLLECNQLGDHYLDCENITARIHQSTFYDTSMVLFASRFADVLLSNSVFTKARDEETGIGGFNITLPQVDGHLEIVKCEFSNQIHVDPVLSAINIESAALRIESFSNNTEELKLEVQIRECVFQGNERALSITREFRKIHIIDCTFNENKVMHAAAAIRLALGGNSEVLIENCSFVMNSAGTSQHADVPGRFKVDDNKVWVNSSQYKGSISLVAKGGAMRIHFAFVTIINCTFENNTAKSLGGSIFVGRHSNLTLVNSSFVGPSVHQHSTQGDIMYSNGNLLITQTTFLVRVSLDHVAILHHSGEHWSMEVESLTFQCPVGHRVMIVNATSHKIERNVGLRKSHKLDQSSYYCQTCGRNHYSLQYGYINYTALNNNTDYFTLLIDGKEPFKHHPISYEYGNISCLKCPFGAICDGKITAVPNFWGYVKDNHAIFQHCPPGYCCSSNMCNSINSCAENRDGKLCGRCQTGLSEAMFSSKCIPNEECNNKWLWPFTLLMGIVYALFLVFMREIRKFMFSWSSELGEIANKCDCLKQVRMKTMVFGTIAQGKPVEQNNRSNMKELQRKESGIEEENNDVTCMQEEKKEAGFLIIMFYYFQDALLLHVDTVYTRGTSRFEKQLKIFMLGLFRFQLDFFQFLEHVCIIKETQPATKQLLKTIFVPYILILLGMFYLFNKWYCMLKLKKNRASLPNPLNKSNKFSSKLASGFILAMMFTYQKMATATFTLLNCVPIGNESVLFIDGTQNCFQSWQFGVMIYAFTCVVPFSIVLMFGPPLLRNNYISLMNFFMGCLCPLPFLVIWFMKYIHKGHADRKRIHGAETKIVLEIMEAPFKEKRCGNIIAQICWSGVLLGRRLILFLCFTFINDILVRLLCMVFICFIILIQHIYIQPYKTHIGNMAGSLSAAALLIVGGINILRATFVSAEYLPRGPNKVLMTVFDKVENILVLWLPLTALCIILFGLVIKLILSLINNLHSKCSYSFCKSK